MAEAATDHTEDSHILEAEVDRQLVREHILERWMLGQQQKLCLRQLGPRPSQSPLESSSLTAKMRSASQEVMTPQMDPEELYGC